MIGLVLDIITMFGQSLGKIGNLMGNFPEGMEHLELREAIPDDSSASDAPKNGNGSRLS